MDTTGPNVSPPVPTRTQTVTIEVGGAFGGAARSSRRLLDSRRHGSRATSDLEPEGGSIFSSSAAAAVGCFHGRRPEGFSRTCGVLNCLAGDQRTQICPAPAGLHQRRDRWRRTRAVVARGEILAARAARVRSSSLRQRPSIRFALLRTSPFEHRCVVAITGERAPRPS